jgi:hypothetical protein
MPAGENVSVSGMVHSGDGTPIHMIKVTIYRDDREVDHVFTGEDGKYVASVAKGKPIAVRFDTHFSLNNAKDWHPSVVANVSAMKDVAVDRVLLRVGQGDGFTRRWRLPMDVIPENRSGSARGGHRVIVRSPNRLSGRSFRPR